YVYFRHPAPTVIYTLSLHDALPISMVVRWILQMMCILSISRSRGKTCQIPGHRTMACWQEATTAPTAWDLSRSVTDRGHGPSRTDRKSTRLNSSHVKISYAVFCLKK